MTIRLTITLLLFFVASLALSTGSAFAECVTTDCHATLAKAASVHDPVAGGECETCHDATGLAHPGKDIGFVFPELGNALCLMCHDDPAASQAHVHPALEDGCISCHNPHAGPAEKMLPAAGPDLCYECHDNKTEGKSHVHSALEDGCTSCHNPHAGPAPKMLQASGAALCYECHDNKAQDKFVHGPVEAGDCSSCHDPHASDAMYQLAEAGPALCLMCHDSKSELVNDEHVHPIVADGCANCHNPHSGPNEYMLPAKGDALCFMCHDDIQSAMNANYSHAALDDGCTTCHDAHGTGQVKMFVMDAAKLCYSCHDDKELEFNAYKSQHQPVKEGYCWGCHAPHGSDWPPLLKGSWPDKFYRAYAPEYYTVCLTCHSRNTFEYERTSEATGFRNGDRNLHYLHVNKEKGRVCKVCHGVHGANQDNLILDKVPGFGKWEIPIEYTTTESGGACLAGCHKPKYYDRVKRVVNK